MIMDHKDMALRWIEGLDQVSREQWDALADPLAGPFLDWEWLRLLETSGSVGQGPSGHTGWTPMHLLALRRGRLVGAAALYRKDHSQGEFVFDHAFALAAARLGEPYYPKLVGMSPFTPAGAYCFADTPGEDGRAASRAMAAEILRRAQAEGMGVQFNYVDPGWGGRAVAWEQWQGLWAWQHQSYLWRDRGYGDFEGFLGTMRHGPRRNICRERAALARGRVAVRVVPGRDAPESWFGLMHDLYLGTNAKFGPFGCGWLTRDFFLGLAGSLRSRLVFTAALVPGRADPLALAMFVRGQDTLYGRYWGCQEHVPFLHFECCYYRPIQWALEQGIGRFDPGIGSEHKARRGFTAVPNVSLHRPASQALRRVMALHMDEINAAEGDWLRELNTGLPFARDQGGADSLPGLDRDGRDH